MISTRRGESNCFSRCRSSHNFRPKNCRRQFLKDFIGMRTLRRCSGSLISEVVDRAAVRSRSSTGGILLDGDPSTTLREPGLFWGSVGAQAVADAFLSFLDGLRRYFSWSGLFLCLLTGGLGCLAFLWQRLEFRL